MESVAPHRVKRRRYRQTGLGAVTTLKHGKRSVAWPVCWSAWLGLCPTLRGCRGLEAAAELPDGFKKFRVGGVPETTPVEIGAQLPDRSHELAGPHLGNESGQGLEGSE